MFAATHAFILLALLATVTLMLVYGRSPEVVAVVCLAALALYSPKRIRTDETGVHAAGFLEICTRLMRWKVSDSVREWAKLLGLPPFDTAFITNWGVDIRSVSGTRPIRFICRHSGRMAFCML
jgi:hypothetical protein